MAPAFWLDIHTSSSSNEPEPNGPGSIDVQHLFHIVPEAQWSDVVDTYRPDSLLTEGFVHCSFADQVAGAADRHYRLVEDLVVVELDPHAIGSEIRVEDSTGSGRAYPHVYGPIPRRAAVAVHALQRDGSGHYLFSPAGRLP
jgi:uncharacterized protein (DUF952 family)